jgi:hypothetical protein
MKREIALIRYVRSNILALIENLSLEQLNTIHAKFNNNIAWNLAHLVITQQTMNYKLGGLPVNVDESWFSAFIPGTKPERDLTENEIVMVKEALITTIDQFEQDYEINKFDNYTPWAIPAGTVEGVEDACNITCVHEGRHYGVITSLVKLVS